MIVENGVNVKLVKLGVKDKFGKSGNPQELAELFGIGEKAIAKEIAKELR